MRRQVGHRQSRLEARYLPEMSEAAQACQAHGEGVKALICWLLNHKLFRWRRSTDGALEQVFCRRCKGVFATHHPTQWFGPWDDEDEQNMSDLGSEPAKRREGK
jgi:hypothetical protein